MSFAVELVHTTVGIDISKAKVDGVVLQASGSTSHTFANTEEGFAALHDWLQHQGAGGCRICLEATGSYSDALARFLAGETLSGLCAQSGGPGGISQKPKQALEK